MKTENDTLLIKYNEATVRRSAVTCKDSDLNHTLYYRQTRTQNSSSSPLWSVHVAGRTHSPLPGLVPG